MRLWVLAWASGLVQKVDVDHWALRPHNRYDLNFFSFLVITMKYCFTKEPKINKQTYKMEITMKVLNSHFQKKKKKDFVSFENTIFKTIDKRLVKMQKKCVLYI